MPAGQDGFPLEEKLVKVAQVKGVQTLTIPRVRRTQILVDWLALTAQPEDD
jgi:hypothetical protein